jgi:protoporphyrinogen oxidase
VIVILGAGLAGLSVSWHLRHRDCVILEASAVMGGHARSVVRDGFTLDHGPHVSFTKHAYVRDLFAENTAGGYHEFPISVANFLGSQIINHPAQVHLWQLPEPLRSSAVADMRSAAAERAVGGAARPADYAEWLRHSFGRTFAEALPSAYTRKYWTVDPSELSTDWLGPRMHTPTSKEIEAALVPGSRNQAYYITSGLYPVAGGYQRFFERFANAAPIRFNARVTRIDPTRREVTAADGTTIAYQRLISTLPLPEFVRLVPDAPDAVRKAADALDCTRLLLVDVFAAKVHHAEYRWYYVYDEDKLATRIHCVESLATANAPPGMTGVQVEVYSSRYRPETAPPDVVAARVAKELVEFGLVGSANLRAGRVTIGWRECPYANVMFTHRRRESLATIYGWLAGHGLAREAADLDATTDWTANFSVAIGTIAMAGRFAQWKYFWTDDCVLRGRQVAAVSRTGAA